MLNDNILAKAKPREHFIPFRRADVLEMCVADAPAAVDAARFRDLCRVITALFHHEYHQKLERLKDSYAPINPDRDTIVLRTVDTDKRRDLEFVEDLKNVIAAANFTPIDRRDIEGALHKESVFKVKLHVDFDDFDDYLFFRRGESRRQEVVRTWWGLRRRTIDFKNFDRVVVYVRFKNEEYFAQRGRRELFFEPGSVMLKAFSNVPSADLEMLFPNTEVRMKPIDKVLVAVPAAVGGAVVLTTRLGATFLLVGALIAYWFGFKKEPVETSQEALVALGSGMAALGAFLWRQYSKFKNRKIRFMKALADSLYYKNIDNNVGVLHRLIDTAEEEEVKEVLLGYYFLLTRGPMVRETLNETIEAWFLERHGVQINFDVGDAVVKLERLGLTLRNAETLEATSLEAACARIDTTWDDFFRFAAAPEAS